jgi:hypothetical protein
MDYTLLTPRQRVTAVPYGVRALNGGSGGSQWVSDGPDLTYPTGGVGVTGGSSPFASGKGVFLEGGSTSLANVFAFNYDSFTPLNLILNAPMAESGSAPRTQGKPRRVPSKQPSSANIRATSGRRVPDSAMGKHTTGAASRARLHLRLAPESTDTLRT